MNNFVTIQFFTKMPYYGAFQLFREWDFFFGTEEVLNYINYFLQTCVIYIEIQPNRLR